MTVAARGWATMSDSALEYFGLPRRTGLRKMSSPSSTMPGITALPPVQHHAGGQHFLVARFAHHLLHQREDLLDARLDHAGQRLAAQHARGRGRPGRAPRPACRGRPGSCLAKPFSTLMSSASLVGVRSAIAMSLVIRSPAIGITAVWRIAPPVKIATSWCSADVDQADAQFLLVVAQHRLARGQRVEHQLVDLEPAAPHALDDVLGRALRAGDDVQPWPPAACRSCRSAPSRPGRRSRIPAARPAAAAGRSRC